MNEVKAISSTREPFLHQEIERQDALPNFYCLSSCASMDEESCCGCVKSFFFGIWTCFQWLKSFFITPVREVGIAERGQVARFIVRWENSNLPLEHECTREVWVSEYLALPAMARTHARSAFIEHYPEEAIQDRPKDPIILAALRSWSGDQIRSSVELD